MRKNYPDAKIGVLANSYNAGVIANNPDVDEIYIYEKAKHTTDKTKPAVWLGNLDVFRRIRKERYDVAVACGSHSATLARYAYLSGAKMRIGYRGKGALGNLLYNRPLAPLSANDHEVERVFNLLHPLGIAGRPGKLILIPDAGEMKRFEAFKKFILKDIGKPLVAVAISARIKANKWPVEKFIALIAKILDHNSAQVLFLWAPGSERNLAFPGDDEAAERISGHFEGRITVYPTPALKSLITAIAGSDIVVTLDTGSLHMSAALNKMTVALMTKGKALTWYPWKTGNVVLTAEKAVEEIRVDDVFEAVNDCIRSFHAA